MAEYEGRSILVLGGSSGIGLEAVAEFKRLGADNIYIGTSRIENYQRALGQLERRKRLNTSSGIYPFVADVTDIIQIENALAEIKDRVLTDVIFSQAGGMEAFMEELFSRHLDPLVDEYTFTTPIDELDEEKQGIVREKLAAMRVDLSLWTQEALPRAIAVNYHGTFYVIETLADMFQSGFKGIFYNSTWGHLSGTPGVEIPLIYRPVDLSKAMVRDRLLRDSTHLFRSYGISMSEVVAGLVNDTRVGKMFNDFFLNLMSKEQKEAVQNSSIYARDVVAATKTIIESDPRDWLSYPRVSFVYGKDGKAVIEDHLEMSPMYTTPYLF